MQLQSFKRLLSLLFFTVNQKVSYNPLKNNKSKHKDNKK